MRRPTRQPARRPLRDIIFKGQTANYFVGLPNGAEIVASGTPRALALQPGDEVVAHWPAGSRRVLQAVAA